MCFPYLKNFSCFRFICFIILAFPSAVMAQPPQQNDPLTGVTIQLPVLGVSVDAAGVLTMNAYPDPTGQLMATRIAASRATLAQDLQRRSPMRKISLRRLESAIETSLRENKGIDEVLQCLAGLQRAEYAFLLPDQNDVVIAGPAEGWVRDLSGRTVGVSSRLPTLVLDDLLVALRTFRSIRKSNTWVAVSINPTAQGIRDLADYQKSIPRVIPDYQRAQAAEVFSRGLRDSLGTTDVAVYGVSRTSNLTRVMVEADYRMKLIAVGLEPPPINDRRMVTFVQALTGAPRDMQRWWLSPQYQCVKQSVDGLGIQLIGRGVALQTENILLGPNAPKKQKRLKPSRAARAYAKSFTRLYPEISQRRPVFAQLRNVIDLLVLSAWITKRKGFHKVGWQPDSLRNPAAIPTVELPDLRHAPSVANAVWKGNLLVLPVGGGVSIQASQALLDDNLLPDNDQSVSKVAEQIEVPDNRWWWD